MAEEPGEPSDGMTQPSREKPQWVWLLLGFLLLVVGSLPWLSTVLPQWGTMLRQWGTILWQWCLESWQRVLFLLRLLLGFLFLLVGSLPWLSTVLPQWGKKLSQKRKAAERWCKEWMGGLPLFAAIAIWAVIGIIAFLLAMWWLGRVPFWQLKLDPEKQAENIVKIALTLVGGVGAVAYLVIKYQERQQAGRAEKREKDRTVDTKVQDAINQLGSDKASTRIAGVYALTDIADTYRGGYRQRVVDILCGYLRSDRETYPLGEDGKPATGLPRSGDADKAVESTILSMFVAHLKKGPRDENGDVTLRQQVRSDHLWCDCDFDLHGAEFHDITDFADCVFEGKADFRLAKFTNLSRFSGAEFTDAADFRGAEFKVGVDFRNTDFVGAARFSGAEFTGKADFTKAKFEGKAGFNLLKVTEINIRSTKFLGDAIFRNAEFTDAADFTGAEFTGMADFGGAEFEGMAYFAGAEFKGKADFTKAKFEGKAYFNRLKVTEINARSTKFLGDAIFRNAEFTGKAYFTGAEFTGKASFNETIFRDDANFGWTKFRGSAKFSGIKGQQPSFAGGKFNRELHDVKREDGTDFYVFDPSLIPENNAGLPKGAVWTIFPDDDKDDGAATDR